MSLVKWGASVNHVTSRGVTPLIKAAVREQHFIGCHLTGVFGGQTLNKPRAATVLRLAGAVVIAETQEGSTAVQVLLPHIERDEIANESDICCYRWRAEWVSTQCSKPC